MMKVMAGNRAIVNVAKVIHHEPEGRGNAHRHTILWKDGGKDLELITGDYATTWKDGGMVVRDGAGQKMCQGIVTESEAKFSGWRRLRGRIS